MFPCLQTLPKTYLCIPGTSVLSECVFSTAGDIVHSERSVLSAQHVDQLPGAGLPPGSGDGAHSVFPFPPGMPLSPCSLQALKPSQMSSAISLLEHFCQLNAWGPPEYYLYSTPGPKILLIYKVVLVSAQSSYMPDKLCTVVEDAKELAAQNTLWNLEGSWLSGGNGPGSPVPLSPPLGAAGVGYGARALTPCLPSPYPLSPLSPPLPSLSQSLYTPLPSPFY
ncbi:putative RNA-binding protein 46 [Merluccius polli]|uniref:RNA-binding protein 46 n=1 Tax=Merluccius polli TaxID=89951 RepID=A0AA47NYX3_MERPO|nr:putative RNA-binding protein 46 [Merluccius polli]